MKQDTSYIVLEHISKQYGQKQVLDDINLKIPIGKVTAIMAPSGTGKTTLLRILMKLEVPDKGSILGMEQKKLSAVFQEDRLCNNLSVLSNIRLVSPKTPLETILSALQQIGLTGCEHQPVHELSGGMQRRVAILRALMADYDVLFLDEPFKGLDLNTKEIVMEYTKNQCVGKTILLITHDENDAQKLNAVQTIRLNESTESP